MTMSPDTRRRVIFLVAALLVTALVLASTGCSTSSSSGPGGGDTADGPELSGSLYAEAMSDICTATTERINALPTPPDEISRSDWATEVSLALRDEAVAFDEIRVGETRRTDHASFVANTQDQAEQWLALSATLTESEAGDDVDAEVLGDITNEIAELTLGRDDLALEMNLTRCQARETT